MSVQLQRRWLIVAIAALLTLQLVAASSSAEQEDKPTINYPALFKAYIRLGDALFGEWVPENFNRDFQDYEV
ncbi:hypothetical protein KR093_010767 [Drosophila rubida]|uniref:Uncharacterized protein n=1 Tax=Drosophila rubida TaxID=30044 RepID=A0AAD4K4J9_9MUSC|nr:hypothetical protein KR093_010767 [Drosophila rubida]